MLKKFLTTINRGQHCIIIDMPIHYLHVYISVKQYTFITLWPSVCCVFFLFPFFHVKYDLVSGFFRDTLPLFIFYFLIFVFIIS